MRILALALLLALVPTVLALEPLARLEGRGVYHTHLGDCPMDVGVVIAQDPDGTAIGQLTYRYDEGHACGGAGYGDFVGGGDRARGWWGRPSHHGLPFVGGYDTWTRIEPNEDGSYRHEGRIGGSPNHMLSVLYLTE